MQLFFTGILFTITVEAFIALYFITKYGKRR